MAVSKRTRYEVLRRDNHACRYCGQMAPDVKLTVDHVTPVALGGTDNPDNLVAACVDCNAGKSSTSPDAALVEDVQQEAVRWAAAMKLAAETLTARRAALLAYVSEFESEARQYNPSMTYAPDDWWDTAEQFYRAGLPVSDLKYALAVAMSKSAVSWNGKWRYACGVAWSIVREMQDEARAIVERDA